MAKSAPWCTELERLHGYTARLKRPWHCLGAQGAAVCKSEGASGGPEVGRSDAARMTRLAVRACRREDVQAIFHRAEEANQAVRHVLAGRHPKLGERECMRPPHEPLVLDKQRSHVERRTPLHALVARQSHRVAVLQHTGLQPPPSHRAVGSITWGCSLH